MVVLHLGNQRLIILHMPECQFNSLALIDDDAFDALGGHNSGQRLNVSIGQKFLNPLLWGCFILKI